MRSSQTRTIFRVSRRPVGRDPEVGRLKTKQFVIFFDLHGAVGREHEKSSRNSTATKPRCSASARIGRRPSLLLSAGGQPTGIFDVELLHNPFGDIVAGKGIGNSREK